MSCQEPDRYERIIDDYGQPEQPLQNKSFDDLVQRAREEKSNVEGYLAMHGQDLPDWLRSV